MKVNRYDIRTNTWVIVEEPDEAIPDDPTPEPTPTTDERIQMLEEELLATKIILGVE